MSRGPRTLGRNDRLQVADDLMRTVRCRHLPVLDDRGRLAGIVSQRTFSERSAAGARIRLQGSRPGAVFSRRQGGHGGARHGTRWKMGCGAQFHVQFSWHADCARIRRTTRVLPPTDGLRLRSGHRRVRGGRVATLAGRCRTDGCPASRSSAAATVGDWQRSTAGGEHRSGRIWPRLRGCVLNSARS